MFWLLRRIWSMGRSRLMLPVLGLAVAAQGWLLVRPGPLPLDDRRLELTDEVARKLAESLPTPAAGRPTLAVLPLERDPTGAVTDAVRRAIDRVDRYTVLPPSLLERVVTECGLTRNTIRLDGAEELDLARIPAEFALVGHVQSLSARSDSDEAVLEGVLIHNASSPGEAVYDHRVSPPGPPWAQEGSVVQEGSVRLRAEVVHDHRPAAKLAGMAAWYQPSRLLFWLLLMLGLPLAAIPLIQRGLDRQSNAVNLLMLLGLTAAAGLGVWAAIGTPIETGLGAALLVLTLVLALGYNWWLLSKLEELRT